MSSQHDGQNADFISVMYFAQSLWANVCVCSVSLYKHSDTLYQTVYLLIDGQISWHSAACNCIVETKPWNFSFWISKIGILGII